MKWNIKKVIFNITLSIIFLIGIYGYTTAGNLEHSIQMENNHVKTVTHKNPLKIKGGLYFVTDDDIHDYEKSKNLSWFGFLGFSFLLYFKKKINIR